MSKPIDALDYLAHPSKHPPLPVCVLFGGESFLKRQAIGELRQAVLGAGDADLSLTTFEGGGATLRDVVDELSTMAMFGSGKRMVVIHDADEFVSKNRSELEDYVAHPKKNGVLVLEVGTWPSNTRLFKALAESGLQLECKFPPPAKLLKWLTAWAKRRHEVQLEPAAAEALVELVEPNLGLFDQELAKLAAIAGVDGTVAAELVNSAVGGWRTKTAWEMLDAAASGDAREALVQLDHLLVGGEVPIALLAQIATSLRRFAAATRLIQQAEAARRRISLREALEQAGFKSFVLGKAEAQLRQLGRVRGKQLYTWLLESDLALKGASSSGPRARLVLEQLVARMARGSG